MNSSTRYRVLAAILFFALLLVLPTGCGDNNPDQNRGKLVIDSQPAGAAVFSGGKELGFTPSSINGPAGTYLLRIQKPGFQTRWVYAAVKAGESSNVNVKLDESGSSVLVNSRPVGAEIRINGELVGSTPLVLENRQPGEYTLQVTKPGYAERQVQFTVADNRPQEVMVTIDSNIGRLILDSEPSQAKLTLNGREVGFTPFQSDIDEGRYQVKLDKAGYITLEAFVVVNRDKQTRQTFTLTGKPGSIAVHSEPEGASVYLDDQLVGTTPVVLADVPAGSHRVRVSKDGYDTVQGDVDVAADTKTEFNTVLGRSTGGIDLVVLPAGVKLYVNDKEYGVVKRDKDSAMPEMVQIRNLVPGTYRVTAAHRNATPERVTIAVQVKKGEIVRPKPLELWVPNVEVKWRKTGLVEIGMLYAETDKTVTFGAERGVKIPYSRDEFEYVKPLEIGE